MPFELQRYGTGWQQFSGHIKHYRARGQCECTGQCARHSPFRCEEKHLTPAKRARGTIRLTTAHLCSCDPPCQNPRHVIAACQKCHLRIDIPRHIATRRAKQLAADAQRRSAASQPQQAPLPFPGPSPPAVPPS